MSPSMRTKARRVVIAAGGTGGHVIPAMEVARELQSRGAEILFVGTAKGLESRLVPERGFPLETIEVGGLMRVGFLKTLNTLAQLPAACWRAMRILDRFVPDVVFGLGAYVSGPVLLVAAMKRIPIVVHEANAVPGFTNRRLAPLVARALVAEEAALSFFPAGRAEVAGMPVAAEFFNVPGKEHRPPYTVLITGGSMGSARLNRTVREALPALAARRDLRVIHQTGEKEFEAVKQAFAEHAIDGQVTPFLRNMPEAMSCADLVVCRAGASTLAELAAAGKAALLVPFPYASDDHQWHNAMARERAGAARVVRDQEFDGPRLVREIDAMLPALAALEAKVRKFAVPDATQRIAAAIESAVSA